MLFERRKVASFASAKSPCKFWLDNVLKFLLTLPSPLTCDWNFNCVNYILTSRLFNKVSARKLDWTKKESFIKKTMSFFPNLRDFILKAVLCVTISIVKNNWSTICVYPLSVTRNLLFNFNNIGERESNPCCVLIFISFSQDFWSWLSRGKVLDRMTI